MHHTNRNVSCATALKQVMRLRFIGLLLALFAALLVVGAGANGTAPVPVAAKKPAKPKKPKAVDLSKSKDLWATINVCDTADHPNTIGIRGSMPGLGNTKARLVMRFQVQYKAKTDGKWHNTDDSADSGWKTVGKTQRKVIESGQDFTFLPPTDGGSHQLRGSVRFKWVKAGKTLARERRYSEVGHRATAGSDPAGYSAGKCEITQP